MKLGKAFSDSVFLEKTIHMRTIHGGDSWWMGTGRALMFATVLFISLFLLAWRLFDLTVIRGREFRALAETNRTRELVRHAPRGVLLDRTGRPLVANVPQYRLIKEVSTVILSKDQGDALLHTGLPAGEFLEVDYRRQYLFESISQITGFTGELGERELKDEYYQLRGYRSGDRVGRTGAEAVYEERLRGRDGKELVEVDASGTILRVLGRQEEIPGENVTLAVDASLSEAAAKAFPPGAKGAVIVSQPTTGEILSLVSFPGYSANKFTLGMSEGEYKALLANPDQPMLNRAIGGVYPPGSTFKIVMGIAGIEEDVVKEDTTVTDEGTITIGPFSFSNWYFNQYGKVEGVVDIVKAIRRSNDIFFYKVGEWLGITKIVKWAHIVGVGRTLGIELPGEATGLMPDPTWKASHFSSPHDKEARNDQWYLGDTYHVSIGQGYLLTTPLQVAAWTNVIASGGMLCRPTILKTEKPECRDSAVKDETITLITEGLVGACAPGGTGWPLFEFGIRKDDKGVATSSGTLTRIPVACKTGTAEFGDPTNRTHAWFTVFAPVPEKDLLDKPTVKTLTGEPELTITVLIEGAGEGSSVAAPVAKAILEEWFRR